ISGNDGHGISIASEAGANQPFVAEQNKVRYNFIGTDKSGTVNLANGKNGIFITDAAGKNSILLNTIAKNKGGGVGLSATAGTGNSVDPNSIFSNGGLGIDLGDDGPTPNHPGDIDTGPNNLQNFPILTSATSFGGTTTIRGSLNSEPTTTF